MPRLSEVRTSLEVGFPNGTLPERFAHLRGRDWRSIGPLAEFPYEDAQFEVVMMDGAMVSRASVREANRVLRPDGILVFTVNERRGGQAGYTLPDIYAVVRDGFSIAEVERPAWWHFGRRGHTLTITARKKVWKDYKGFTREGTFPFSPFRSRT